MNEQDLARLIATLEHLKHPFDRKQISRLPKTDKRPALDYVNHAHVTNRLNQYAPDWSYTLDEMFTQGGECWVRGTMTIYGASRVEFGKGKNPLEAMSHFIRRAAMRFGVATDLWAKEDFEDTGVVSNAAAAGADTPSASTPDQSENVSLDGADSDAAPVSTGGADTGAATPSDEDELGTALQWQRLAELCQGNATRMVNRLRKATGTSKSKADFQQTATKRELAAAINGESA